MSASAGRSAIDCSWRRVNRSTLCIRPPRARLPANAKLLTGKPPDASSSPCVCGPTTRSCAQLRPIRPEWSPTAGETPAVAKPRGLSTDRSGCYGIPSRIHADRLRSKYLEPWGLVRALESPETELFKIVRVLSSPLGLIRHGKKTQKERVGEAKNNDHNLLLRPRSRVF